MRGRNRILEHCLFPQTVGYLFFAEMSYRPANLLVCRCLQTHVFIQTQFIYFLFSSTEPLLFWTTPLAKFNFLLRICMWNGIFLDEIFVFLIFFSFPDPLFFLFLFFFRLQICWIFLFGGPERTSLRFFSGLWLVYQKTSTFYFYFAIELTLSS